MRRQSRPDVSQAEQERDLRYQQQFAALTDAIAALSALTDAKFVTYRTLIDSQAEKVALALASADKAVTKAESANERRFDSVNEFRQTLTDQAAQFVTRREFETLRLGGTERMDDMKARMDQGTGEQQGGRTKAGDQRATIATIVGVAALFLTVIVIAVNIITSR